MADSHADPLPLERIAETDAIRRLLCSAARLNRKPAPVAEPVIEKIRPPAAAFVAETEPARVEEPPNLSSSRPVVEDPPPVPLPVGALSFGALLARINWRNRPDAPPPLPMIGVPDPPGHADTVGAILAAFSWDDE